MANFQLRDEEEEEEEEGSAPEWERRRRRESGGSSNIDVPRSERGAPFSPGGQEGIRSIPYPRPLF